MRFAPDTVASLDFVVALVNTAPGASRSGADELPDPEALTDLLTAHRYSGRFDRDETELAAVLKTRALFRRVFALHRDDAVDIVNSMLSDAQALPQLVRHDAFDWHLHATDQDAPLAERMRVEAALALVDVLRTDEMGRLRECAAPDCDGVLVDLSRNSSKHYCSVRCGNRMNTMAFRARAAAAEG